MERRDKVWVFAEWCDGPRAGVADFRGAPYLFLSDFADADDNGNEEALLLLPLTAAELPQLVNDLLTGGGAWSHCGGVVYPGDDGTLYPPVDAAHQARGRHDRDDFSAVWKRFKAQVLSRAEGCIIARGADFQVSAVVPAECVEGDCHDRLPLEVEWPAVSFRAGREAIEAALGRWGRITAAHEASYGGEVAGEDLLF
jgi:hypothetical protein